MHEGVVCREVLDISLKTAQENGITKLDVIVLVIGTYSCIHEKELLFYFDMAKIGTIAQNAVLKIEVDKNLTEYGAEYVKEIQGQTSG